MKKYFLTFYQNIKLKYKILGYYGAYESKKKNKIIIFPLFQEI